jgi:TonB family protein
MKIVVKILGGLSLALVQAAAQSPSQSAAPVASGVSANAPQPTTEQGTSRTGPTYTVAPDYPKKARKRKIEGPVVLHIRIGEDGKVREVSVVSGDPELAEAAARAVKKWRYQPLLIAGKPTEATRDVTVNFTLENADSALSREGQSKEDYDKQIASRIAAGELFRVGGAIAPPKLIYGPDPGYTESAKEEHLEGTVVLAVVVGAEGLPHDIRVTRAIGKGLDEEAIDAVRQWRFKPATKDGKPVTVVISVEVTFHLT